MLLDPEDPESVVLFDLGLSQRSGGTLPYAAPEALFGEASEASDLFSLGAILFECWSGRPWVSLVQTTPKQALELVLTQPPLPLPEGNPALSAVLSRLLQKNPTQRYSSAAQLQSALSRSIGEERVVAVFPTKERGRAPMLGREEALAWLRARAYGSLAIVSGEEGVGKSRLVHSFFQWCSVVISRTERRSARLWRGSWSALLSEFAPQLLAQSQWLSLESACGILLDALLLLLERGPLLFHIDADASIALALENHFFTRKLSTEQPFCLIIECRDRVSESEHRLCLLPLSEIDASSVAASLKGSALSAEEHSSLRFSGGSPAAIEAIIWGGAAKFVERHASLLSKPEATALLCLCLLEGAPISLIEDAAGLQTEAAVLWGRLASLGWVVQRQALPMLANQSWKEPLIKQFSVLARSIAEANQGLPGLSFASQAELFLLLQERERAADCYESAAQHLLRCIDAPAARHALERALTLSERHLRRRKALMAELLLRGGLLDEALQLAMAAQEITGEAPTEAALSSLVATIYSRLGQHQSALDSAMRGLSLAPLPELSLLLRAQASRALLAQGKPTQAQSLAAALIEYPSYGAARLLEAQGLILLHLGDALALSLFEQAKQAFLSQGDIASVARALSTIGMAQQAAGQFPEAVRSFEEALAYAGPGGASDLQAAATYSLNLGAVLHSQGRLQEAETSYQRGLLWLDRFGDASEKGGAYYNYATLCLDLGDLSVAAMNAQRALQHATQAQSRYVEGYCYLLLGDIAIAHQQSEVALEHHLKACALFRQVQNPRGEAHALAALLRAAPNDKHSGDLLRRLQELEPSAGAQAEVAECSGLCRLEEQRYQEAAHLLSWSAALYQKRSEPDRRWRVLARSAEALQQLDPEAALATRAEAISTLEELSRHVPEDRRVLFWRDPARRQLLGAPQDAYAEKKLARLLEISKRLNLEPDRERLLGFILDAVVELVNAERGFLLTPDGDSFRVACVRHISGEELSPQMPSRSIAEEAAHGDSPLVTTDAEADPRFLEARSVVGLQLRSVLAAPLRARGKLLGCVYVDDRQRRGAFGPHDVSLVREFGELAAIVLDNSQLQQENLERQDDIERLNRALSTRVAEQQEELVVVREALQRSGAELRSKYNYSNIIGRSPKMRALFSLLDRVTDSEVPVLIVGESGTGKELVAKAIHYNGHRSERALISENCAAIPEGLMESALFGHIKGAFTGAERERKGLFELAHRGTLFLDEIGETSPKMQARLLRVLQEHEVRRVGADRPFAVDVRVITATNRDLRKMVEERFFREDLYFRLAVVRVELPPLRERKEDIPLLVAHFLSQQGLAARVEISSRAMARLLSYPWPGNVRELENEVTRAALLCDGLIEERHFSAALLGAAAPEPAPATKPTSRVLKAQVEELERRELIRVLGEVGINRSKAAEKLGLSRFGLLKKMKRYGLDNKSKYDF
jgi:transcriptional regulator with GAF, ATPase, and Fis domain